MNEKQIVGMTVCKNYKLIKKIGAGAFGQIYLAVNQNSTNEEYAVQLQKADNPHPQIFFQAQLYQYLHHDSNATNTDQGIPKVLYCGVQGQYNVMMMELLGKSLEDLFNQNNRKFTLQTVLMVGLQMIERIQFMHTRNFLHRDIKPDNFLMGINQRSHQVYVIDFGLAQRYIGKDGKHIPYRENKSLTGTARYASINTHVGIQQARRDDLQSLGYVLLYFLRGSLPWQNLKANNKKEKYEQIMQQKMGTPTEVLCKGFPTQFCSYLNYCKNLRFEDKPDYVYLQNLFKDILSKQGWQNDCQFDWRKNVASEPKEMIPPSSIIRKLPTNINFQLSLVDKRNNSMLDNTNPFNQGSQINDSQLVVQNQLTNALGSVQYNQSTNKNLINMSGGGGTNGINNNSTAINFSKMEKRNSIQYLDGDQQQSKNKSPFSREDQQLQTVLLNSIANAQNSNNPSSRLQTNYGKDRNSLLMTQIYTQPNQQYNSVFPSPIKTPPITSNQIPAPQIVNIKANR